MIYHSFPLLDQFRLSHSPVQHRGREVVLVDHRLEGVSRLSVHEKPQLSSPKFPNGLSLEMLAFTRLISRSNQQVHIPTLPISYLMQTRVLFISVIPVQLEFLS